MTNKIKDLLHATLGLVGAGFGYLILIVAITALVGCCIMFPILVIAFVYWLACLVTGAIFTWVYPAAIGLLFLVMLGLAWYEGDSM